MNRTLRVGSVLLCLTVVGCLTPNRSGQYMADKSRSYERFDPYADEDLGGEMTSRPRGYMHQRTQERRASENRMMRGAPEPAGPTPVGQTPFDNRAALGYRTQTYPNAIRE